jgi:NHL repeat-containing protein
VLVSAYWSVSGGLVWLWGVACAKCRVASERVLSRGLSVLALGVVASLALFAGVARAEPPKLISYGSFDSDTLLPVGVAVDQSSGDVYAAGLFNEETYEQVPVNKFDASGGLLAPPSPFGQGYHSGAAVNPTNGDVYVLSNIFLNFIFGPPMVATYEPSTGALVGSPFPVPASNNFGGLFTIVQIAADSKGNVYVPVPRKETAPGSGTYTSNDEVIEYSSTGTLLGTFTGGSGDGNLKEPTGVVVDPAGNVWVADTGNGRVEELNPSDAPIAEIKSEGVEAVALDAKGDVFALVTNSADFCGSVVSPCPHVVEYDSAGAQVADVGAGSLGGYQYQSSAPSMLAVDEASGRVYVSDAAREAVLIFGPPTAPVVDRELTSEVTTSEVKLGAFVNPGGMPTSYRFEYDTREYAEGEGPHGQSTPFPEGSVGEGVASRTVWAAASGLAPGTTYHYRVIASNELGTSYGADRTFTTLTAAQAACSNDELRGGFSTKLTDCRAYELVTAPATNSSQVRDIGPPSVDGSAISFRTEEPLPNASSGGGFYVVTRGAAGWSAEGIMPLESYSGILCLSESESLVTGSGSLGGFSSDLSKVIIEYGSKTRASQDSSSTSECNAEGLQVVQGEPVGYENLLMRDNSTGAYRLVNMPSVGVTPADAHFKGASPDFSHVFFTERAPLAPGAQYGVENLFEWDEGNLRLLTVLPDGTPAAGSLPVDRGGQPRPISTDGSRVLFTSGGGLYDRIGGERTVQVDEAQGGPGPSGGGSFQAASADGLRVLFLDASKLTADSTAETGEPDLYECEIIEEEQAGKKVSRCKLSDLTVATTGEHADVLRASGFGSKDSSHVYFMTKGVLPSNKRQYTDGQGNTVVEEAKSGQENLYVDQNGTVTFIASFKTGDYRSDAVSPDGTWFAIDSTKSLTGYENNHLEEIFLYDEANGQLTCASCVPSGEPPTSYFPGARLSAMRPVSDGGRVFFDTGDALVPSDTNGRVDVYEYENGQPSLISSGTSTSDSALKDASESGSDVFFQATQQLVPQDTNENANVVYDARVGGGFPAIATPPACTTADACRAAVSPQPSIYGAPSSQTFSGVGNLTPTAQGRVKKKAKPKGSNRCKRLRNRHKRSVCVAQQRKHEHSNRKARGGK